MTYQHVCKSILFHHILIGIPKYWVNQFKIQPTSTNQYNPSELNNQLVYRHLQAPVQKHELKRTFRQHPPLRNKNEI